MAKKRKKPQRDTDLSQPKSSVTSNTEEQLIEQVHSVDPSIPRKQVLKVIGITKEAVVTKYRGALPPADELGKYNNSFPNGAERIFNLVEGQSLDRRNAEKKIVKHDIISAYVGMFMAFFIVMTSIILGSFLIHNGKDIEGLAAVIVALVSASTIFIIGKHQSNKDFATAQRQIKERIRGRDS